jgi:predicted restriction endonuclease
MPARRTWLRTKARLVSRTALRRTGRASARRKARDGLSDAEWTLAVMERDGYRCQAAIVGVCCRYHLTDDIGAVLQAHHIKPRSKGGRNTLDNGLTCCARCHHDIHHVDPKRARAEGLLI